VTININDDFDELLYWVCILLLFEWSGQATIMVILHNVVYGLAVITECIALQKFFYELADKNSLTKTHFFYVYFLVLHFKHCFLGRICFPDSSQKLMRRIWKHAFFIDIFTSFFTS